MQICTHQGMLHTHSHAHACAHTHTPPGPLEEEPSNG